MDAVPERRRRTRSTDAPVAPRLEHGGPGAARGGAARGGAARGGAARGGAALDHPLDGGALDDDAAPLFSVGQVAQLVGLAPWFLRRLDSLGVVTPTRSEGDHRRYSRADIRRLLAARALMHDGVSVAGVRHVFELEDRVAELEDALRTARTHEIKNTGDRARRPARSPESSCGEEAHQRTR